ncbi:MAG: hypothetical protein LBO81_00300 [Clostridiales Family XIII bacterium]|jgi:hypothetical protein|nr:hypothetical protein [Clostridiales Family XIII bacterium]
MRNGKPDGSVIKKGARLASSKRTDGAKRGALLVLLSCLLLFAGCAGDSAGNRENADSSAPTSTDATEDKEVEDDSAVEEADARVDMRYIEEVQDSVLLYDKNGIRIYTGAVAFPDRLAKELIPGAFIHFTMNYEVGCDYEKPEGSPQYADIVFTNIVINGIPQKTDADTGIVVNGIPQEDNTVEFIHIIGRSSGTKSIRFAPDNIILNDKGFYMIDPSVPYTITADITVRIYNKDFEGGSKVVDTGKMQVEIPAGFSGKRRQNEIWTMD